MQILASYAARQKILVVFDEFQEIAKYSEAGFEKRLRKVIQGHGNVSYFFCDSQQHLLIQMFDSAGRAFCKMARSYPLPAIGVDPYLAWAQKLFQKKNIALDDRIITAIVERCEFQPLYIQQFLFDLWRSDAMFKKWGTGSALNRRVLLAPYLSTFMNSPEPLGRSIPSVCFVN